MNGYADYEYYIDTYCGDMIEVHFNRQIVRVSSFIDYITFGRLGGPEAAPEEVKYAACEMCDVLQAYEDAKVEGRDVQSVSNAGYSVTFAGSADTGGANAEMNRIAQRYIPAHLLSMCVYEKGRRFDE